MRAVCCVCGVLCDVCCVLLLLWLLLWLLLLLLLHLHCCCDMLCKCFLSCSFFSKAALPACLPLGAQRMRKSLPTCEKQAETDGAPVLHPHNDQALGQVQRLMQPWLLGLAPWPSGRETTPSSKHT